MFAHVQDAGCGEIFSEDNEGADELTGPFVWDVPVYLRDSLLITPTAFVASSWATLPEIEAFLTEVCKVMSQSARMPCSRQLQEEGTIIATQGSLRFPRTDGLRRTLWCLKDSSWVALHRRGT